MAYMSRTSFDSKRWSVKWLGWFSRCLRAWLLGRKGRWFTGQDSSGMEIYRYRYRSHSARILNWNFAAGPLLLQCCGNGSRRKESHWLPSEVMVPNSLVFLLTSLVVRFSKGYWAWSSSWSCCGLWCSHWRTPTLFRRIISRMESCTPI